jgi:putative transposase
MNGSERLDSKSILPRGDVACYVSTGSSKNKRMAEISPKPDQIATIIRSYKSAVSNKARCIDLNFAWQARFHDHVIRDFKSFDKIQHYIKNNPVTWKDDRFYNK